MDCILCKSGLITTAGGRPLILKCSHIICERCFDEKMCPICGEESPEPIERYISMSIINILEQLSVIGHQSTNSELFHCNKHSIEFYCKVHKEFLCEGCSLQHMDHKYSVISYSYENFNSDIDNLHQAVTKIKDECSQLEELLVAANDGRTKSLLKPLTQALDFTTRCSVNIDDVLSFPRPVDSVILEQKDIDVLLGITARNTKLKPELLYRGSRDGFEPENFHRRCDGQGATLLVVYLKMNGRETVVGGFTETPWSSSGGYKQANPDDFIFLLDPLTVLRAEPNEKPGTYHDATYGPVFGGGHDLEVLSNKLVRGYPYTYDLATGDSTESFPQIKDVRYDDIEVFRVY